MKLLIVMMVVWNLITFSMMGIDKHRAEKDKPRIREKTLITVTFPIGIIVNAAVIYGLFCLNII